MVICCADSRTICGEGDGGDSKSDDAEENSCFHSGELLILFFRGSDSTGAVLLFVESGRMRVAEHYAENAKPALTPDPNRS